MRIFISHSSKDIAFVRGLVVHLKQAGYRVWHTEEVLPGDNWALAVGKALEKSNAMVVVLSPEAVKSPWMLADIEYALGSLKFKGRLIPVEVRPTKDIPWILRQMHVIRASKNPSQTARRIVEQLSRSRCRFPPGATGHTARRLPIQLHPPIAEGVV